MRLSLHTFDNLGQTLCVAVSGGADSLALCLMVQDWAGQNNRKIVAVSVDHALRKESVNECKWVAETLASYGIVHHTLCWQGEKPTQGLQAKARQERYRLIENWCASHGIKDVLLGHHLNDQAETFMMRLARGSGVDGLSAMQAESTYGRIRLLRPLLDCPKADLIAYLEARGQDWIEDPSNLNVDFERVKWRSVMADLETLGLTPKRLAQTAQNMQRARYSLQKLVEHWLALHATVREEGYILLSRDALFGDDEEVILRGLARIGQAVGGEIYPPRLEKLMRLYKKLCDEFEGTLMGCRWILQKDSILICREVRTSDLPESLYSFDYEGSLSNATLEILGEKGWREVIAKQPDLKESGLPKPVIYGLPALWDKEGVLVVPHLGYKRQDVAFELEMNFLGLNRVNS
ncbi:MAG: tRNA lysidine(34) synthetase TilS [Methylocystaceae bacterium]|nr:tRNA lysidine(34) synthetase TilS [Methylocystaceae bacterium]